MSATAASVSGEQRLLAGAGGDEQLRVIVAGAGLAGLATAVALHKVHGANRCQHSCACCNLMQSAAVWAKYSALL